MLKGVRWGRGFFRLWVAISIVWIILISAILWQPIVNPLPLGSGYLVEPMNAEAVRFPRYSTQWSDVEARVRNGELHQTQIEFSGRIDTVIYYPAATTDQEKELIFQKNRVQVVNDRNAEIADIRMTNVKNLLLLALIPSLALLGLGLIVRWIFRGFAHQPA